MLCQPCVLQAQTYALSCHDIVQLLAQLDHPNIIAYKESFVDSADGGLWCVLKCQPYIVFVFGLVQFDDIGALTILLTDAYHLPDL